MICPHSGLFAGVAKRSNAADSSDPFLSLLKRKKSLDGKERETYGLRDLLA